MSKVPYFSQSRFPGQTERKFANFTAYISKSRILLSREEINETGDQRNASRKTRAHIPLFLTLRAMFCLAKANTVSLNR